MKRLATLIFALSVAGIASAEPRNVGDFKDVTASGRFRVEIAIGPAFAVQVEGPDAAKIATRVDGDTLKIEPTRRPWFGGEPRYDALIRVTAPRLEGVAAARGAIVNVAGGGECTGFDAVAAMGAELRVRDLFCANVEAAAAMGGTVELAGACRLLDVTAAMGGSVDAEALRCETVDASAAMGGNVEAFALQTYDASAAMGGAISVSGGGRAADRDAVMGGSVTERN
jgi:Putative auto-transporter adhesin, head GIN domain